MNSVREFRVGSEDAAHDERYVTNTVQQGKQKDGACCPVFRLLLLRLQSFTPYSGEHESGEDAACCYHECGDHKRYYLADFQQEEDGAVKRFSHKHGTAGYLSVEPVVDPHQTEAGPLTDLYQ